jgi:aspartate/glutamate racemase
VAIGAKELFLGCTEIPILVNKEDINLPIYETLKFMLN